jgi:hypothetical protein
MNMLSRRPVQLVVGVIVALALFGGGFAFGSTRTTPATSTTVATGAAAFGRTGQGAAGAGAAGGAAANRGLTSGQIIAVNTDSITVQVRAGGQNGASPTVTTQLVLVGTGTRVVKTSETDVKLTDLKVGDQVTVAGTPDTASGTVSASAIVLGGTNILGDILGGTQFPGGRGGAGASGNPRPSASPTR